MISMAAINTMWRKRVIAGLILLALTVVVGFSIKNKAGAAGNAGEISVDRPRIDIGKISERQAASIDEQFHVANRTNHIVEIVSVDHSCTCTSSTVVPRMIQPGGVSLIDMHINWFGRRGSQMTAAIVRTKNPDGFLQLTVTGAVDMGVELSPGSLDLGLLEPGAVATRLVLLARTDQVEQHPTSFAIQRVSPSIDGITLAEVDGGGRNPEAAWFQVTVSADKLPLSANDAHIDFIPVDQKLKAVSLPINYVLSPLIRPIAGSVRFRGGANETQVVRFHLYRLGAKDIAFTIVDAFGQISGRLRVKEVRQDLPSDIEVVVEANGDDHSSVRESRLCANVNMTEVASVSLLKF